MTAQTAGPILSIVVPTFKEAGNVRTLVDRIGAALEGVDWEVIFVDDDSPDGTADAVRALFEAAGLADVRSVRDLAGIPRVVSGRARGG